jgi:hypothetical protein
MRVSHPVAGGSAEASLSHRRLRTVSWPVMGNIQLNPLEGLVKIDHIQKEPPLNLKGNTGHQRGRNVR